MKTKFFTFAMFVAYLCVGSSVKAEPDIIMIEKDLYIQNENIQGETRIYTGNTIYVGNNVTSTKPTGDVNIQNSHIIVRGKQLELHSGTRIDKNFIFQNR